MCTYPKIEAVATGYPRRRPLLPSGTMPNSARARWRARLQNNASIGVSAAFMRILCATTCFHAGRYLNAWAGDRVRAQPADFYRDIDASIQMGKDFAGSTNGRNHGYETLQAADVKEEPYASTEDNNSDSEAPGRPRMHMMGKLPQIYSEWKQG